MKKQCQTDVEILYFSNRVGFREWYDKMDEQGKDVLELN